MLDYTRWQVRVTMTTTPAVLSGAWRWYSKHTVYYIECIEKLRT